MRSAGALSQVALAAGGFADTPALTVYALSYWHYLLYWRAYRHGTAAPARFRRDAVVTKTLALIVLAWAYLPVQTPAATIVVAAGFALNALAARALGPERTYYGWEIGDVPYERVTSFPYSVVPHPMLLGNVVAYGGTLLSPTFRAAWWPLALSHVVLNAGLFVMETVVTPRRVPLGGGGGARWSVPSPGAGRMDSAHTKENR